MYSPMIRRSSPVGAGGGTSAPCCSSSTIICGPPPRASLPDAPRADADAAGAGRDGSRSLAAGTRRHLAVVLGARAFAAPQRAHDLRGAPPQAPRAPATRTRRGRADALDGVVAGQP